MGLLAAVSTFGAWAPSFAQPTQLVQSVPDPNDPVERLGRYIRILAGYPRDLDALLGAGQAALDVGDANAALGFYARAEDVSPSSGRVKAGLGSSLVMIERPDDALRLFAEAVSLGVPEVAVARDRGLAYDLRGDSKRAQRDYALAMTRGRDEELVRRYALSLGISGDRAGAMALLEPLLRKQDQGAWRARAFIMAMNGDVSGANGVARQLMVPAMASAMAPLLSRLASLNPAERAHAVNFGTIPADGTQLAVQTGDPFLASVPRGSIVSGQGLSRPPVISGDAGLIPTGEPLGPRPTDVKPTRVVVADSTEPRRRPGQDITTPSPTPATVPVPAPPVSTSAVRPGFSEAFPTPGSVGVRQEEVKVAQATPLPSINPAPAPATRSTTATTPLPAVVATEPPPQAVTPPAVDKPVPTSSISAPAARLAGLLDGIEPEPETDVALPNAAELRAARAAARKKMAQLAAQTAAEEAEKREKAEKAAAAKRNPARIWVQVATGRNDSGLGITLRRIRDDNEKLLKGLSGWSAPYKATNRILVGPMKSAAAARELVGKLAKNGVSAMTFNSDPGEEVEKIAGK